jgi:hypothetical protein
MSSNSNNKSLRHISDIASPGRDSAGIQPFLEEVGKIWLKMPDMRFGQLMYNFFHECGDPFYLEDDKFLEEFKKYYEGNI